MFGVLSYKQVPTLCNTAGRPHETLGFKQKIVNFLIWKSLTQKKIPGKGVKNSDKSNVQKIRDKIINKEKIDRLQNPGQNKMAVSWEPPGRPLILPSTRVALKAGEGRTHKTEA